MTNAFATKFDDFACEGDTISAEVDGYTITARLVRDDHSGAPDQNDDGFWPSLDPESAGYIGANPEKSFEEQKARAQEVMQAWKDDEWFYVGVVLSVERNGVMLDKHAASLWGIECNYPPYREGHTPNDYLTEVANELLPEALERAKAARKETLAKLA